MHPKMADWFALLMLPFLPGILLLLAGLGLFENEKIKEFVIAGGLRQALVWWDLSLPHANNTRL